MTTRWPAIIGIVIGSLIVLSIVFCCVRCLCCGLECCCGCFSCFNSCCPGPRRHKGSKYADGPSSYHGYQPAPAPPTYEPPKFASFDVSKKGGKTNGDSLPAMPSWDNAKTHKVEDHSYDDVEMGRLDPHSQMSGAVPQTGRSGKGGYNELGNSVGTPYSESAPSYRGADTENPYDLGAQKYHNPDQLTQHAPTPAGYDRYGSPPMNTVEPDHSHDGFQSPPQPYNPPQQYHAYGSQAPTLPSYRSYAPSQSTMYEPAHSEQSYGPHGTSPTEERNNRPPSLLQAGRPAPPGGNHY